jgi:signal transduction histidine kinase
LNLTEVQPAELLATVIRQMGSRLQDRKVEVSPSADDSVVTVDRDLIQLALRQLLDNAVKYSPATRPIRLGAEHRDDRFAFWVADEGPGVRPADADRVFTRFYRASPQRHGVPGSGLGLAVVRQIAEAHGGAATLADTQAKGARFELIVPTMKGVGR